MNGKVGALAYLLVRTTRNRLVKQVSRIRNPRYALALLFGVGYFYLVFLRPGSVGRASSGAALTSVHSAVLSFMLFLTVAVTWLFSRTGGALAFLPAEVQFLFTAPLTRHQLIGYRMVRSQLVLLLNALIWTVLLRRFGLSLPAPIRFATAWAIFSVLSLHQLGTALVLVSPSHGARRVAGWTGRALVIGAVLALVGGLLPVFRRFGGLDFAAAFELIRTAVASPPVSMVLAPFQLLVAPIMATSPGAWASSFAVVLGIIALHVIWAFSMDVAFADVAVAASAKRAARIAAMKAARGGDAVAPKTGKATRHWLPLAPLGHPGMAIAWKNTIALFRGSGVRTIVIVVAIGFMVVMAQGMESGNGAERSAAAAAPFLLLVSMTMLMGPRMLRNDLRQDLLRLATLKTYPLKGNIMVAAETLSPTIVLTAFQFLILGIGYAMIPGAARAIGATGLSAALIIVLLSALLAINAVNVVIQNGIVLMFPSWVRLGADSGGVEAMGQNLLVTVGSMFALLLALVLPIGAGVALVVFVQFTAGSAAIPGAMAAGGLVAVLLMALEVVAMVNIFGRTFDRIDPTTIT